LRNERDGKFSEKSKALNIPRNENLEMHKSTSTCILCFANVHEDNQNRDVKVRMIRKSSFAYISRTTMLVFFKCCLRYVTHNSFHNIGCEFVKRGAFASGNDVDY
jgi:hypothetical protein